MGIMDNEPITVTDAAVVYLAQIAEKKQCHDLRVGVQNPGTNSPQCYLSFASSKDDDDQVIECKGFSIRYQRSLGRFLEGMCIDYREDRYGGKVRLKTPNLARLDDFPEDADLLTQTNWVLRVYVNPFLEEHQGSVMADRAEGNRVWLKFGGNCLGCGNAEATLVNFVEAELKNHIPKIQSVIDATIH